MRWNFVTRSLPIPMCAYPTVVSLTLGPSQEMVGRLLSAMPHVPLESMVATEQQFCLFSFALADGSSRKWTGMSVARRLFRFGRPACVSQHLCPRKWNPVLELHQPLRLCRPPPELIGQRDKNLMSSQPIRSFSGTPAIRSPSARAVGTA